VTAPLAEGWSAAALWAVFVVGLAGGFGHCIAMCGPLAAASALAGGSAARARGRAPGPALALWQAGYHGGRVMTYACIGALLGAVGSVWTLRAALAPVQRWVWVVAGALMIVMGLAAAGAPLFSRLGRGIESGAGVATSGWFARAFGWLAARGPWAAVPLGMLNGLLPCGFLLSIEASALASGSALLGGLTMLAFGLGTVPALAGFGAASGLLGVRGRTWLLYVGGAVVIALGVTYIVRGVTALAGAG